MPSPFPGMDPYLETPHLWPDVHHGLISHIQIALNPLLPPRYVARVELRVYVSDDNEIEEAHVEIRETRSQELVTVIEVMSPTNKIRASCGRTSFMQKRREIMDSDVHWVEIDLLCAGLSSVTRPPLVPSDYRILVSRAGDRARAHYWPISVRQSLPAIGVPLRGKDPDVPLDMSAVLHGVYEHGAYDRSIDYRHPPDPPLAAEDAAWAEALLRKRRLR